MPDTTISATEFVRYLEERINRTILVPLVPYPEAIARFGRDPVTVTVDQATGEATLSTPTRAPGASPT
jgi:hypothetical protein